MTLEEKLKEKAFNTSTELKISGDRKVCDGIYIEDKIGVITYDDALSICQQEIAEACKEQREICASKVAWIDASHSYKVMDSVLNAPSPEEVKVKPEIAVKKNLYKVTLAHGYDNGKRFSFIVVATGIEPAVDLAIKTFNGYDYGNCIFNHIELIASEGQYAKPEILLIAE